MSKLILLFSKYISKFTLNISAISMGVLALLVFYQVITRFIFNSPSELSESLARMVMVWMVYLSMSSTFQSGSMISITFFVDHLPNKVGIWGNRLVTAVVLFFLIFLIFIGSDFAFQVRSQTIALLDISAFWMYLSIPAGCFLAIPAVLEWHLINIENVPPLDGSDQVSTINMEENNKLEGV